MKSENWIGRRIGRLTIVEFQGIRAFQSGGRSAYFRFRCDCGNEFSAQKSNVISKRSDCGCSKSAPVRTMPSGSWAHPLYKTWVHMIDRCCNPSNKSFKDYGQRGIRVAERWTVGTGSVTGFECFCLDMGDRPTGFTIERVDGNRGYEPSNCMWIAKGEQSKNRRGVKLIRLHGVSHTIPEWCAIHGISYWTAIRRISRGWSPDRAVTSQPRQTAE